MSTSPPPPALGRPLSFPHPHYTSPVERDVNPSTQPYTSVPLRQDSSSSSRGMGRDGQTDDTHSSANTFGTTDRLQQGTQAYPESGAAVVPNDEDAVARPSNLQPENGSLYNQRTGDQSHTIAAGAEDDTDSSTIRHDSQAASDRPDSHANGHKLTDPDQKRFKKAGVAVAAASGAGAAGKVLLARGRGDGEGRREPRGWRDIEIEDKHGLFSKRIKEQRWSAVKKGAGLYLFITVWLWICLPIFWGSTYDLLSYLPRLTVHVISFDTPMSTSYLQNPMIQQANTIASLPSSTPHLGFEVKDPANYPNGIGDVQQSVLAQECWAAVVINANASIAWTNALYDGDASYDPTGAVTIYFASARFYQVTLLYIEALVTESITNPLNTARANALQAFITASESDATLLANAAKVPQAIGTAFGYTIHDLRPIPNSAWAGAAPMEASLIYFVIFAFYVALFGGIARMKSGLAQRLRFSSMLRLRLGWPILAYFFISLWETLVVRAFQVPLNTVLGRGGFVALWALNYLTIMAAGLAMETVLALVGLAWLPFFLILWIILNITSSFYPIEVMPIFYRFLRWMPFLHNVEGYKIIAFGTNLTHRLGLHYGVLFAIIGVELVCLPLSIAFERWKSDRDANRQQEKKEQEKDE